MRIFVTGVGGQLGHDVMNELAKRGYEGVFSAISTKYLYAVPLAMPTASAIFVVDGDCLFCR